MRHYKKGRKLGTDASHTKAMKKSLVAALFLNDRIKTTETRAKEIRPEVDRVITWAKRGDVHSRRLAIALLGDKQLVAEVFEKVQQGMWMDRNGGYSRIMKLGPRKGDNAPMVIMELVQEPNTKKEAKKAAPKKEEAKVAAPAEETKVEEEVIEITPEKEMIEAANELDEVRIEDEVIEVNPVKETIEAAAELEEKKGE